MSSFIKPVIFAAGVLGTVFAQGVGAQVIEPAKDNDHEKIVARGILTSGDKLAKVTLGYKITKDGIVAYQAKHGNHILTDDVIACTDIRKIAESISSPGGRKSIEDGIVRASDVDFIDRNRRLGQVKLALDAAKDCRRLGFGAK